MTATISSTIATALAKGWVRAVLVLYLVGLALVCIYVPWESRYRGSRSAWGYGFIWSPPAESLTVDLLRLLLSAFALTGITLAALLIIGTTGRRTVAAARTAEFERRGDVVDSVTRPAMDAPEDESRRDGRAGPDTLAAPVAGEDEPRSAGDFRANGYELTKADDGRTFMDKRAADRLAGSLRASGHNVRVQRLNFFMHVVWAKPAERPAPPVTAAGRAGASPKPAYQGAAAEVLGPPIPAHEALLLLAEPGGRLRPEFMDWEGDLPLEPGSLVPVWYPRKVDGEELNAEQRNAQFRFDLALLLASHCPTTPASGPPAMHVESDCTAHDVLRALLELRSVWRQE